MNLAQRLEALKPLIGEPPAPTQGEQAKPVSWHVYRAQAALDTGIWSPNGAKIPISLTVIERVIHGGGMWGLSDKHDYAAEMTVGDDFKQTMSGPAGKTTTYRGPDDIWRIVGQYNRSNPRIYVNGSRL